MSEEDLELKALQRQLDDAFETTRPRSGFEDELWVRMQELRPARSRLRDAFAGLWQGVRTVPAVPMAGLAALLVVVIGVGIIAYTGVGRGTGGATSSAGGTAFNGSQATQLSAGSFGRLPSPALGSTTRGSASAAAPALAAPQDEYAGPVQLTWTGHLTPTIAAAPVFRYREPTTASADQFASALGAALRSRPGGYLGSYSSTDYTLEVRGTVQAPPQSPAYFIYSSPSMPPVDAAGAAPQDLASFFLAQHSLTPDWSYQASADMSSGLVKVTLQRQFDAPGYGPAFLVDAQGQHYGMEVDLNGNQVVHVAGLLPVALETATYPIISSDAAIRAAIGTGTPVPVTATPPPSVALTQAELAYLLVPAGDHSFYEPVFVFWGTFQMDGKTYMKHVIVAAVDPSQRQP